MYSNHLPHVMVKIGYQTNFLTKNAQDFSQNLQVISKLKIRIKICIFT